MIIIARLLCNCGDDITDPNAGIVIGADVYCHKCALEMARNIIGGASNDPDLRAKAIEILALAAISTNTPKENRS